MEQKSIFFQNNFDGQIILVGSILGYKVIPLAFTDFCSASKHAVRALAEGWRLEVMT